MLEKYLKQGTAHLSGVSFFLRFILVLQRKENHVTVWPEAVEKPQGRLNFPLEQWGAITAYPSVFSAVSPDR